MFLHLFFLLSGTSASKILQFDVYLVLTRYFYLELHMTGKKVKVDNELTEVRICRSTKTCCFSSKSFQSRLHVWTIKITLPTVQPESLRMQYCCNLTLIQWHITKREWHFHLLVFFFSVYWANILPCECCSFFSFGAGWNSSKQSSYQKSLGKLHVAEHLQMAPFSCVYGLVYN